MKSIFVGANIKGTPAMSAQKVRADLSRIQRIADVIGVQEFKWTWYWRVAILVLGLGTKWSAYPGRVRSLADPIFGAQGLFWKRELFHKRHGYYRPVYNFRMNFRGIMTKRYVRAVLLESKSDKFTAWFLTTHFVVGADGDHAPRLQRTLMRQNIRALGMALTVLQKSGYPIMGELDANIHKGTWAHGEFMQMMNKHGAKFHGQEGVEYAFTIEGNHGAFTSVEADVIPTSELNTDHEARVLIWEGHARN